MSGSSKNNCNLIFCGIFFSFLVLVVFAIHFPKIKEDFTKKTTQWDFFSVSYKDRYYLDLNIDAEAPLCLTITDDAGQAVYTVKSSEITEDDLMLRLDKGEYKIYLSDFAGGAFDISYQLE